MLKRILSILVIGAILLSFTQLVSFAQEYDPDSEMEMEQAYGSGANTDTGESEKISTKNEESVLIPEDKKAEQSMAIPEKAAKLVDGLGLLDTDTLDGAQDVSYSDFYNVYKKLSNSEPSEFENDNYVTFMYVIKEFVSLANYDIYAKIKGGYPYGYIIAAESMDMLDGIKVGNYDNFVDYSSFCMMIYNMLLTPVYVEDAFVAENGEVKSSEYTVGVSMLEDRFGVLISKGVLTGTEKSDIYGGDVDEGNIKIDGKLYCYTGESVYHLTGHRIEYYYKENSPLDEVIIIAEDNNQDITTVYSSDAEGLLGTTFIYKNENSRKKTINVPTGTLVLKNGVFAGYTGTYDLSADLDVLRGKIEFIDNDNDGQLDLISLTEYAVRIVDSVNRSLKIIHFKDNLGKIALGEIYTQDEEKVSYSLKHSGRDVDLEFVLPWDVLLVSYAKGSSGKNFYDIEVVRHRVSGIITATDTENKKIYIDDIEYGIAPCLNADKIKLGIYADFLIAGNNEVADIIEQRGYSYGFLMAAATKAGLSSSGQLKLMTESGESRIFELADKVKYNGTGKKEEECISALVGKYMLIAYETNDDGEISKIYTAESVNKDETKFSLDADHTNIDDTITGDDRYIQYREDVFIYRNPFFNDLYSPSNECVVFYVNPAVIDSDTAPEDEDINVGGSTSIANMIDTTSSYETYLVRAKMYDTDEFYRADAIVIYREDFAGGNLTANYAGIAVVDSVKFADIDGEEYCQIKYYKNGSTELETAYAKPGEITKADNLSGYEFKYYDDITSISQVKCGDVIQIGTDSEGLITTFRPIFLVNKEYIEGEYWGDTIYKFWSKFEMIYTKIKTVKDTNYIAKVDSNDRFIRFTKGDSAENFVYDTESKTLTFCPDMTITDELAEDVTIFMIRAYSKIMMQMIIK